MDILIIRGEDRSAVDALKRQVREHDVTIMNEDELSARSLNRYLKDVTGEHFMLIDARQNPILLMGSAFQLYTLIAEVSRGWSMIYSDYEIDTDGEITEEHLLDHHAGRVRESVDYGPVWFINVKALKRALPLQEDVKQHMLYDLRLRLSEQGELLHIANRYSGVTYRVTRSRHGQNVFDYLLQSKESQLELESIATEHLKRIKAFLPEGQGYKPVPYAEQEYPRKASIIIPVNNRPEFIGAAIESVQAQTVQDIEIIVVVNGGSDDPTIKAVNDYLPGGTHYREDAPPVKLLVVDINNIGFCLNTGLKHAQGKFYVQLDSDDQLAPDAVEKVLAVYAEDPTIGMVIGSYEVWEKKSDGNLVRMESIPVVTHDEWTEANGRNNLLRINGAGAPRSFYVDAARDLGYLDMNITPYARNYGEDYEFVLRMSENHRIGRVWDPIYKVIRHSGGTDHSIDQATVDRNNNAKDHMRLEALRRRKQLNEELNG